MNEFIDDECTSTGEFRVELERLRAINAELVAALQDVLAWHDRARAAIATLRESLAKLSNELRGVLSCYEHELRQVMGNTNFAVLESRLREASDALEQNKISGPKW